MSVNSLTDEQQTKYRKTFEKFDKDGNGSITTTELGTVLRALGMNPSLAEIEEMIHEVDLDGSGTVELNEFLDLMARQVRAAAVSDEDELRQAFEVFDRNKDGFLTVNELSAVMKTVGERLTEDELADLLQEADVDKDGKINFEEFMTVLMK